MCCTGGNFGGFRGLGACWFGFGKFGVSPGPLTVLRHVGTQGAWTDLRGCALCCTRRAQAVSAQVGHLIGDGLGACPVASIGLRGFRVYIGVYRGVSKPLTILGRAGTLWSADRPGRVFVVSPQWHSSSYCVGTGCTYFVAGSQHLSKA